MDWTSFDVCAKVRSTLEHQLRRDTGYVIKRKNRLKVGHGGTLDPIAEGVLVVGIGERCKDLGSYLSGAKGYVARGKLGIETDSQDRTGEQTAMRPWEHVRREDLQMAADNLTGNIMQRPPMFSAVKRGGKALHKLARAGQIEEMDVEERPIQVHRLQVLTFDTSTGEFELDISCGGGTYVRTLIVSMGRAVGSAAHMDALCRTRVGPFCLVNDANAADGAVIQPIIVDDFGSADRIYEAMVDAAGKLPADVQGSSVRD